jgi:hypothetical protein
LDSIISGEKPLGGLQYEQSFRESLVGDHLETSPYQISFMDTVDWRLLCKVKLEKNQLEKFKDAIYNDAFFEMFVEDLPMWGYSGVWGGTTYLYPHLHFYFGYNGDQIVAAKVTTDVREHIQFARFRNAADGKVTQLTYNSLLLCTDGSSGRYYQRGGSPDRSVFVLGRMVRGTQFALERPYEPIHRLAFRAVVLWNALALDYPLLCSGSSLDGFVDKAATWSKT